MKTDSGYTNRKLTINEQQLKNHCTICVWLGGEIINKVVAVEDNLEPVKKHLTSQGCQVISLEKAKDQQIDAVVLSGMDQNIMGMENVMINAPIITASGKSAEEIWDEISRRS